MEARRGRLGVIRRVLRFLECLLFHDPRACEMESPTGVLVCLEPDCWCRW